LQSVCARFNAWLGVHQVVSFTDTGFPELEKEATDGMELLRANMAGIDLSAMDPMQRMLYARMQQNALLLQKLTTPKRSQDMMSLLAGGVSILP